MLYSLCLLTIGILGFAGATWFFPGLAALCQIAAKPAAPAAREQIAPRRIDVVIPVHNEAEVVALTVHSIRAAQAFLQLRYPVTVNILAGLDACTDNTREILERIGVSYIETEQNVGKWSMLLKLLQSSEEADWIIFVDSGALWPVNLLTEVYHEMSRADHIAVAPSYENLRGSCVERLHWSVERALKQLENFAGGPVSVHGATVAYRTATLRDCVRQISAGNWYNDDVVIPLALRLHNPAARVRYLKNVRVSDSGQRAAAYELGRRKRMALGNVQWFELLSHEPKQPGFRIVQLLALRRIFRLFWGYWLLALGGGSMLALLHVALWFGALPFTAALAVLGACLVAALRRRQTPRIVQALIASLQSPLYLLKPRRNEIGWT